MDSIKHNISSVFRSGSHSSSSSDLFAELQFDESKNSSNSPSQRRKHKKAKGKKKRVTWSAEVIDNANIGSLQSPVIILCANLVDVS